MSKLKRLRDEDEYENLNTDGMNFDKEVNNVLSPIISKWIDDGYSFTDIHQLLQSGVNDLFYRLRLKHEFRKFD